MNDATTDLDDGDGVFDAPEWLDAVDARLKGLGVKRGQRAWVREVLGMAEVDVLPEPAVLVPESSRREVFAAWTAGGRDFQFRFVGVKRLDVNFAASSGPPPVFAPGVVGMVRGGLSWVYPGLYGAGEGVADVA